MKPTCIKLKLLTYSLLGLLVLSSCEQDAYFVVPDGHSKLYAFSEITTDSKIRVEVNTAPGINTSDNFEFPKQSDAQVILFKDGVPLADPNFRYISREKAFISQGAFTPEAGVEYGLEVSLKDNREIKPIYGSTTIPEAEVIDGVKILNFEESQINTESKYFSFELDIDFEGSKSPFFVIKPYFLNDHGVEESLIIKQILSGGKGARPSRFNAGILVDREKLEGHLRVVLVNKNHVKLDLKIYDNIFFEIQTITEHAYAYFKALSRQVDAQSAVVAEPVISYTNFENGLGLFTGYSSSITKLKF